MSTIFLKRLAEKESGIEISIMCRPAHAEIFRNLDFVKEVLFIENQKSAFRQLGPCRWDVSYILPISFSSAYLFWRAGIPERIGYSSEGRGLFLTRRLGFDSRWHYVRRYLGLLGEEASDIHDVHPIFPYRESSRLSFNMLFEKPLKEPIVGLAPGSTAPARRWFPHRFAEIARRVVEELGGSIVMFGGTGDQPYARKVADLSGVEVTDLTGKTDLGVFAAGLERCQALVTNESGAMHMAWAVGTPVVILAGPSDARLTAPWGDSVKVLQSRELFCVPCVRNECWRGGVEYMSCMRNMSVNEAQNSLDILLNVIH